MASPELFDYAFYAWLEANGVEFTEENWAHAKPPFRATIDLNKLCAAVHEVIGVKSWELLMEQG